MAETSSIDSFIQEHEKTIRYLEKRRGNMLIIDFANNIMVTYDYNNGSWEDAMKYFTKYQTDMNEKFAFLPDFKLGDALRNLPAGVQGKLAVKAIMRSLLQLRHDGSLDIVSNLVSDIKDNRGISKSFLKEGLSEEFKDHREHIEGWIDPRMKAIMKEHGGSQKNIGAGNIRLIKAGRDNRLELWYKYFNQFPTVICKHIFAATADILPFEYIWACDEPDETIIAYRKALEYIFGEICEESFFFCSFSEYESKGAQSPIRKNRTHNFKNMCDMMYYESLALPKNFRDYLVKDPATWPTMRKMEVNKTNDGGVGAKRRAQNRTGGMAGVLKRVQREMDEEQEHERKRQRR